jgi:3-oxoacyl-[acyl-carrier-protein] synthase II
MKPPRNRRVFVLGYGAATPLGAGFETSYSRAVRGESGFRKLTRCRVDCLSDVVGEIPDWDPLSLPYVDRKEVYNWNAGFVLLTVAVCEEALKRSRLQIDEAISGRTACLIGSALNGSDAYRAAMQTFLEKGPLRISPFLLPNLCANLPSGKASMVFGFTGPIFSPQSACASGNHAIGIGARMIRDGDCDFALVGGVDTCLIPEIIHGFANMNATVKIVPDDRAYADPKMASRPFSIDRKGMVLSEGCAVLVLAAQEMVAAHGLRAIAEICGVGWTSDAHHFTRPYPNTVTRAIRDAIEDAELKPQDIQYINAHGTSTSKGDRFEVECLRTVFGDRLHAIPISSTKSQIGHSLGAAAAIEAALSIEAMRNRILLPTINYIPDPEIDDIDVVPNIARFYDYEIMLSNAFGFGGTNCCIVFRGV